MKHLNPKRILSLFPAILFFLLEIGFPTEILAAVNTSALETSPWNAVAESSIIDENGWLQSLCATDQYIVCLVNGAKKTTEPDTLIAFYRNTSDSNGNPVEQYSYAFHVTETDYEHGNGMTYNPNTQEIAIAGLFTNDSSNAGAIFIVDANTLKFKRKVTVGDGSWNYFGIDYIPEKDQYVLMANRVADYSFVFTDSSFQITDVMNLGLSSSRSSFQDFTVSGDFIISIPYMQRDGYMNVVDVYSISRKQRIGSYYLTLPGHDAFDVEPEGICQLAPGHLLMASAILGTTNFKLYETQLPIFYNITSSSENGTIDMNLSGSEHESLTVNFSPNEHFELGSLIVDGSDIPLNGNETSYTFEDLTSDHSIHVTFQPIPSYTIRIEAKNGTVQEAQTTIYRGDSYTLHSKPDKSYSLTKCLVDGKRTNLKKADGNLVLENIHADHTVQLIYGRIWLRILLPLVLMTGTVFPVLLFLHVQRRKKRKLRKRELRKIRRSSKYFFNALDELEELELHPEDTPELQEKYHSLMAELGLSDSENDEWS